MRHKLGGDYARDTHRGGFGDDYARDGGWSGGGRADDVVREEPEGDEPAAEKEDGGLKPTAPRSGVSKDAPRSRR